MTVAGWLFWREKVTRPFLVGLFVAISGMVVLVGPNLTIGGTRLAGDALAAERVELAHGRDPVRDLLHVASSEARAQLRLPDEHDLQQTSPRFHLRERTNLVEQWRGQVLRHVDHQRREGVNGFERGQELVQLNPEIGPRRPFQPSLLQFIDRDLTKADQQHSE